MRINNVHGMITAILVSYVVVGTCNALKEFHVGGAEGWVPHPSQPFNQWAQSTRFHVNDRLVFDYKKDEDSVLVVNKQHYDLCDVSNPYLRLFGGKSIYDLGRPGKFFFISGNHTRCEGGEKVVIMVMSTNRSPPPPLPVSLCPASHPPPPPPHSPKTPSSDKTMPVLHPLPHKSSSVSLSSRVLGALVCLVLMVCVVSVNNILDMY